MIEDPDNFDLGDFNGNFDLSDGFFESNNENAENNNFERIPLTDEPPLGRFNGTGDFQKPNRRSALMSNHIPIGSRNFDDDDFSSPQTDFKRNFVPITGFDAVPMGDSGVFNNDIPFNDNIEKTEEKPAPIELERTVSNKRLITGSLLSKKPEIIPPISENNDEDQQDTNLFENMPLNNQIPFKNLERSPLSQPFFNNNGPNLESLNQAIPNNIGFSSKLPDKVPDLPINIALPITPQPIIPQQIPPPQPAPQSAPVLSPSPQPQYLHHPIENSFSSSLDRSFSNFKRMFYGEFSTLLRHNSSLNTSFEVDEYTERLTSELSSIIEAPIQLSDTQSLSIPRKVGTVIDEQTKPITSILADTEAKNSMSADHHMYELKQLYEEIETLKNTLKTSSENILRELERERQNSASIRDAEHAKSREFEQRLRSIKLKQIELDARAKNQGIENDSISRSLKSLEQKRREWEEDTLPGLADDGSQLRRRILEELNSLKSEIGSETAEELQNIINTGVKLIKEEGEGYRNELIELEMSNKWMSSRSMSSRTKRVSAPKKVRKSSVLDQTQEKLSRIRKQREDAMKDLSDQLR